MKILAKQNRELIMINAQNTQNENDAEKIILQVPEQYEDFNKKIVFVTPDGNVWDIITNNEYLIKKAITKYKQVDFYIWLTKGDVDFRSQTKTLKFYHNVDASDEITDEEIGRVNTVINLLEEEITKVENLETEIDGKLEEVDTAIDNIHTAIQETENLDLDAEKVGQTTTVTLTKKDGTTKVVHVDDGVDLQFMWQGTSLGIKTTEQAEYTFVNLQGIQGPAGPQGEPFTIKKTYSSVAEMNADFNNMQLGDYVMIASTVEVEDNAKLYTRGESQWIFITDFSGATGIRGEVGLTPNIQIGTVAQGSSFNVTRTGTNENPILNFTLVKGDKGDVGSQGPVGATGNGIASITKTGTSGLVDTYTITYTNGNTTTFTITNGEDGEVTETELNVLREKVADQQKVINQLPQVTGQGTEVTLQDTIEAQFTKFDEKGNSVQDGTPSPDNKVPIYSAGDNENIWNGEIERGAINGDGLDVDATNRVRNVGYYELNKGTYTLSYKGAEQSVVYIFNANKVKVNNPSWENGKSTFTLEENGYIKYALKQSDNREMNVNDVSEIKLEKGNKASGYSPYGMGSINEKIQTSNLIDIIRTLGTPSNTGYDNTNKRTFDVTTLIKFLTANNYYNAGVQIDYSLINNGIKITTKQAGYGIGFPVILSSAKTYTISANIDVIDNQMIRAIFYKEDGTYISNVTSFGTNKFLTFTTTDDTYFVVVMLTPKANVETTYSNIMLNEGNTALPYVEHKEQDYSIFVQQPMRSIGDVRDCFVQKDGSWYERHYIGEVVLNGSENWGLAERSETSNGVFYIENFLNTYGIIREQCLSNYGTYVTGYSNKVGQFDVHYSQLRFYAYNNTATINDWKNKLTEKNLVINGFLAEPLDLPCTETQIQQLENKPSTYKDFTTIQSEDETEAYLEVSGIYDLNKLINN